MPTIEPRSLLERRIALTNKIGLANPQFAQCRTHRRPGALADTDCRDIRRLDQDDIDPRIEMSVMFRRDEACSNPPSGTAADYDDSLDGCTHQSCHYR